ncbi:Stk1 family PASTA domain-containing Ser/Thr kinase [Pseudarthrobacter sp. J75]|uniref:Stk1 family PASTA domain-containing Ser/Thr kinase n=1 Tax=unclassified Pseudarthrobacter TaxID=2647000 RepID=UPI002E8248F0|nr:MULTISPECIES: Stk1 family PASTA domain-containing Ser/Thr kinase [unclassified Pseudarthrobacter]MEE2523750.1 Stk1 family PASTA domain-containing Ser/Thr kinase [Pseudarthrobacter sp. J47]MEE2529916.1 Stk1 family PASTA domain-containing Ser/Thr kinase [Pseudarthrobacter sp. J75]
MSDSPRTPSHRDDTVPVANRRVLNGRYELGELLGRGGMADVYRGTDTRLGRTVAVKLLRPDLARDPQFQARFKREAQAVAALNHASIVSIYDTGEHAEDPTSEDSVRLPFIVMEYVPGQTLRDLIRAGEVSLDQAIDYTLGVLSALEYSHKAGIVHRDIKPANVMVCGTDNGVKVMDFGIARAMADSAATMTQTQAVVGTAQYLSPEQALGETVDARSDLYSAGCLLYELLTGRPPFVGDSPVSVAYQHVREIAEPAAAHNPEVTAALDSVLTKALQKRRTDRFADAAAFQRALRAARNGVPVPAPSAGEAATDPHHHVAAADPGPATEAFALTGASFLDDRPGTWRSGQSSEVTDDADDATAIAPLAAAYDSVDQNDMPLGLPPERERTQPQKSRRRTWIATLVIFTLLILTGAGLWLNSVVNAPQAVIATVSVPSVESLTESAALQKLYDADLRPTINRVQHPTVAKGLAIGTEPDEGAVLERDAEVVLNISEGPSSVKVPEGLVGMTEAAARDLLRQSGLAGGDGTTRAHSPTVPVGMVISTNPGAGQTVAVGTKVELVVSTGKVAMPDLVGRTREEAEAALKELNLAAAVNEVENSQVQAGVVTAQSDPPNAEVEPGRTITLTVAKAPAPPPPPAPSETPKDPPTPPKEQPTPGPKKAD